MGLTILGGLIVKREKKETRRRLRETAAAAVNLAGKLDIAVLADDPDFRSLCKELAGEKEGTVQARARFLSDLPPDAVAHYIAKGPPKWAAAQTVAVITDLAPEWLYDCATSRRLLIKVGDHPGLGSKS